MIVVDTHILLWWVSAAEPLSMAASNVIKKTLSNNGEIIVSSISAWEHSDAN